MSEREVFLAAREILNPVARTAFLDEACAGDVALRKRVEHLLREDAGDCSILDMLPAIHEDTIAEDGFPFLAPAGRPDSLGRLDHYEMLEVLGQGGFGIVFRAFDEVLQRVVAVKVLAPQLAVNSPARKRFLREARSVARVRHENVVQVYVVGEQPLPYLVMEFIAGETLQERLNRIGPLEVAEVLRIGRQIAEGLAAAHATELIHRDVKPANVLIERAPHQPVKLTDFGLARAADDASISQSGLVAGTPMYMSPEQARGERLDHRSDLFSLGSVLYVMTTGRPPFRAANTLAVLKRVNEDTPRPIADVIPEAPQWLCDIISKLHAKDREARPQSAREVADLLANCQGICHQPKGVPALAGPACSPQAAAESAPLVPDSVAKFAKPMGRGRHGRWRWAAMAAAAVLLLFACLGLTESTGATNLRGTVIRLVTSEGTLIVETDDPGVSIAIDGVDVSITGAGVKELRVKPGQYRVQASKDGKVVRQELVTVTRNGTQVVRVSLESLPVPKGDCALEFDGAASYVDIPSLSRDEDDPLTIEAFVTVAGTRGAVLVRLEGTCPCQMYGWPGKQNAGQWVPNGMDHLGVKMDAALTPGLTPGSRAHVAFQMDEKASQLFIDGRKVNSTPRTSGPGKGTRQGAVLGGQWNAQISSLFSGKLDEVRISKTLRYDGDFTPAKRFTPDKDTIALYHCDEGSGDKLTDSSGNGHHGKVVGAKWVKND